VRRLSLAAAGSAVASRSGVATRRMPNRPLHETTARQSPAMAVTAASSATRFSSSPAVAVALEVVEEEPGDDGVVGAHRCERHGNARQCGGGERDEVAAAALGVTRGPMECRALRR
jgi:hypothetical protein